jgi:putative ABC transport system permease protein
MEYSGNARRGSRALDIVSMSPASLVLARIWRNKRRSFLTAASLAASVFIVGALEGLLDHLARFPTAKGSATRLICHARTSFLEKLPQSYVDKIRAVPGVLAATPYVFFGGTYRDFTPQTSFAQFAVDADALRVVIPEIETIDPATGEPSQDLYERFRVDRSAAVAGRNLFERFGWRTGDRITLRGAMTPVDLDLTLVAAIRAQPGAESNLLYFHFEALDEAAGRPGTVRGIMLRAADVEVMSSVIDRIDGMFANSDNETLTESEQALRARALTMLGNVEFLLRAISLALAVMMWMVTANTVSMATRDRATEIAIQKALGFTPKRVVAAVVAESAVIAAGAASLAVAALYIAIPVARARFVESPFARLLSDLWIPPSVAVRAPALGIGVAVLAALLPAWNAARRPILEGLRHRG